MATRSVAPNNTNHSWLWSSLDFVEEGVVGRAHIDPLAQAFSGVVMSNIAAAQMITIPDDYKNKLDAYANSGSCSVGDGVLLARARARWPVFYVGGWVLDLQPQANAMTLDRHVFCRSNPEVHTYVHEMVHVTQYLDLGSTAFLASYFGLSGTTILYRMCKNLPLQKMDSSPHESQAYRIEQSFDAWHPANP